MTEGKDGGAAVSRRSAFALIGVAIAVNMIAHLHRASTAVVTPEIMAEFSFAPAYMALVVSSYFIAATLCQIPSGVAFDRFGLTATIPALLVVGAFGAMAFALAATGPTMMLGRVLSGIGCGTMIMASLVVCAQVAPPDRFPVYVGFVLAVGQIGNVLATTPFALLSDAIGWRGAFLWLAGATAALAVVYHFAARGVAVRPARDGESLGRSLMGAAAILADRRLWPIFAMAFAGYSTIFAIMGLWGGVYLDALGLDLVARGNGLMAMAVGFAVGMYLMGRVHDRVGSAKTAAMIGVGSALACLLALAALERPGALAATTLFGLLGAAGGFAGNIITHGRQFYRPHEIGRGVTVMNTLVLAGATAAQLWTGAFVGALFAAFPDDPVFVFRMLFLALALWLGAGLAIYRRASPSPGEARPAPRGRSHAR